jgi:pimeloyl-ACP methyl ester carboxylesterase
MATETPPNELARGGHADPATSKGQIEPYLTPQQLVQIGEGRTINLVCLGQGSPTVVLTAGLGDWSFAWRFVQGPLARRTRVCAWDRAGYGFSGPSAEPQDIVHTTKDLERAMKSAGIPGPYVMVGHSLGGYEALQFTDRHRQSVVGMVLVEPAIPDQQALIERILPWFVMKGVVKQLEDCATTLRSGTVKSSAPEFEQCTAAPGVPADFPDLKVTIARLNADPARLLTQASAVREFDSNGDDCREVINGERRYGDMPLIVLTAGRDEAQLLQMFGSGTPAELAQAREQIGQFYRGAWVPAHDAYAALSTGGRNQLVQDSGHSIQLEKPNAVIAAVIEVLDQIRASHLQQP